MCRWVRQPEGDQITPPFCKVSDKDVDKMLILVMADSLKMLGTSPFLMSLVATKNLPASSLSSTLKMSLPKARSSWLNCASRDDEAVYWVSIGHYEAIAVVN